MHRAVVLLGVVVAVAAGWATEEHLFRDSQDPGTVRIRGSFRRGGGAPAAPVEAAPPAEAPEGAGDGGEIPVPAPPPAPPTGAPGATEPAAPPETTKAPEPEVPEPPADRLVSDVKLPVAPNGKPLPAGPIREVHVDPENAMKWFGENGATTEYRDLKHLGSDLRGQRDAAFVIVADAQVPWRQIRDMVRTAQESEVAGIYLGVAQPSDPDVLRVLPLQQVAWDSEAAKAGETETPMPEGAAFHLVLESKEGTPVLSLDGRKLESFPPDLAVAWNEWRRAHPDVADTSTPEATHVVFEAPKSASIAHVVQVLDVLRGLGIQCERLAGATAFRPGR